MRITGLVGIAVPDADTIKIDAESDGVALEFEMSRPLAEDLTVALQKAFALPAHLPGGFLRTTPVQGIGVQKDPLEGTVVVRFRIEGEVMLVLAMDLELPSRFAADLLSEVD